MSWHDHETQIPTGLYPRDGEPRYFISEERIARLERHARTAFRDGIGIGLLIGMSVIGCAWLVAGAW